MMIRSVSSGFIWLLYSYHGLLLAYLEVTVGASSLVFFSNVYWKTAEATTGLPTPMNHLKLNVECDDFLEIHVDDGYICLPVWLSERQLRCQWPVT